MSPKYSWATFEGFEKYDLKYVFWIEAPNYLLIYFRKTNEASDTPNERIYLSKDGGNSFTLWSPTYNGNPIYIDEFVATKNILFGKSNINRLFFYVDSNLKILSAEPLERNELAIPSLFNPPYIIKLVLTDITGVKRVFDLYISRNFGKTFEKIDDFVEEASWIFNTSNIIYLTNSTVRILDVLNNFKEIYIFFNITRFYPIRNEFILLEYDQSVDKNGKMDILNMGNSRENTIKTLHLRRSGLRIDSTIVLKFNDYSFDEGRNWHRKRSKANNYIDIISLEYQNYRAIAAIDYNTLTNIYTLHLFDFSNVIDRMCEIDDFESWYVPRDSGQCFQGQEVAYLRKKPLAVCVDNRSSVIPTIKPCPCSLEDFHCKSNYYSKDKICIFDPFSNVTESLKTCRDGGIPLNHLNGFVTLDPNFCSPMSEGLDENSEYAEYCISNDFRIEINIFYADALIECQLDYKGHYLPASSFNNHSLPITINDNYPISYDISSKTIYLFYNNMIFRFYENNGSFTDNETSLYRLDFDVVSLTYDYLNSLLFILDTNRRLFVISFQTNYIKLLSRDVTAFRYHTNTLAVSFATTDQICYYILYSNINCLDSESDIKKYVYSPESQFHIWLLHNNTLFVSRHSNVGKTNKYESEDFCYCMDTEGSSKEYVCDENDSECLNQLCVGLRCKNGNCRRNNVRSNSIDDCGDLTDETNCDQICHSSEHLCHGVCFSNAFICDDLTYEYPHVNMNEVSRHRSATDDFTDNNTI
ncbi:Vacuolar protein sorting/targeting protein 10 [Thelohanellus kitauei]|uniref:Vacuolar protein sorting/targeting protein 10 n=1 Tax=Thelohanellus kitauei TaxID=669202 RepID=A0A0C2M9Y6_THEKT|nr:Vacuolar protein sorting/targeting protein 10 [Thelohanellus kitauei]